MDQATFKNIATHGMEIIMPAKSKAQFKLMEMALHNPKRVLPKNAAVLGMSRKQLSDFVSASPRNLPNKKKKGK